MKISAQTPGETMATVQKIVLERHLIGSTRVVAFHDVKFELLTHTADGMLMDLRAFVWAHKLQDEKVTLSVSYPASLWQGFKRRWFPGWAIRRWPVRETKVEQSHQFRTIALLPQFSYEAPRGCGEAVITSYVTRVGKP